MSTIIITEYNSHINAIKKILIECQQNDLKFTKNKKNISAKLKILYKLLLQEKKYTACFINHEIIQTLNVVDNNDLDILQNSINFLQQYLNLSITSQNNYFLHNLFQLDNLRIVQKQVLFTENCFLIKEQEPYLYGYEVNDAICCQIIQDKKNNNIIRFLLNDIKKYLMNDDSYHYSLSKIAKLIKLFANTDNALLWNLVMFIIQNIKQINHNFVALKTILQNITNLYLQYFCIEKTTDKLFELIPNYVATLSYYCWLIQCNLKIKSNQCLSTHIEIVSIWLNNLSLCKDENSTLLRLDLSSMIANAISCIDNISKRKQYNCQWILHILLQISDNCILLEFYSIYSQLNAKIIKIKSILADYNIIAKDHNNKLVAILHEIKNFVYDEHNFAINRITNNNNFMHKPKIICKYLIEKENCISINDYNKSPLWSYIEQQQLSVDKYNKLTTEMITNYCIIQKTILRMRSCLYMKNIAQRKQKLNMELNYLTNLYKSIFHIDDKNFVPNIDINFMQNIMFTLFADTKQINFAKMQAFIPVTIFYRVTIILFNIIKSLLNDKEHSISKLYISAKIKHQNLSFNISFVKCNNIAKYDGLAQNILQQQLDTNFGVITTNNEHDIAANIYKLSGEFNLLLGKNNVTINLLFPLKNYFSSAYRIKSAVSFINNAQEIHNEDIYTFNKILSKNFHDYCGGEMNDDGKFYLLQQKIA